MATTKIVSVESTHPFIVRGVYARSIFRQELTIDEIYQCLTQQTSVTEHVPDGTTKRLVVPSGICSVTEVCCVKH